MVPPAHFADAQAVATWMKSYYLKPQPELVLEAFATLAATKEFGANADQTWAQTAFFWAVMRQNAASMAEWCATIGPLAEPAKTWWWTAVWMSQTEAGNQALKAAMELPDGHAGQVKYPWLKDPPQDILQRAFRGTQQISMLWHAFYATGEQRMIFKLYEGFVPPEPRAARDAVDAQLREKRVEKNKQIVIATRLSFAENLPKHPKAIEICKASIENLKDPVKSEIAKLVADAEAAVPAPAATGDESATQAPTNSEPKEGTSAPQVKPDTTPETTPDAKPESTPSPAPTPR